MYDINDEYSELEISKEGNLKKCRVTPMDFDFEDFQNLVTKRRDTNCVFEEATGFFRFRGGKTTMRILVNKRHTNNNYIFIFHSIKQVPKDLFELVNFIVLFKTNDLFPDIKNKRPELQKAWFYNNRASNKFINQTIKFF